MDKRNPACWPAPGMTWDQWRNDVAVRLLAALVSSLPLIDATDRRVAVIAIHGADVLVSELQKKLDAEFEARKC
uniref:Uncharacterized protein n=1 Tax=viral metagenome TaxID=1070528 RepID=A0A6M3XQR9_9ZZZZ